MQERGDERTLGVGPACPTGQTAGSAPFAVANSQHAFWTAGVHLSVYPVDPLVQRAARGNSSSRLSSPARRDGAVRPLVARRR
jgi:hypothetical protein